MQILRAGTVVQARCRRWRVVEARAFDDCQVVTLSGLGPANTGIAVQLLAPFDSIEPIQSSPQLRLVRPARWRHACRDLLTRSRSDAVLCAVGRARIDLLPHQLEPAIAIVRGHGCRLLLADDVGLGKTIEAGVTIAELRARGAADRVLILTPAGLREQWAGELSQRFDIQADVVDFRGVARRVAALPYGVNPWTTWPIAIASIDYVKRAEVLPAVLSCSWNMVVVDEAHGLVGDSDRHAAVEAIAARAPYVVLLTATPHNGDARAFRSLCGLGGHRDRLLIFRRTRDVVKPATGRRVHRLLLRPSADERRMHALLADFSRAVRAERGEANRDVWLALAVLHKRAFSSAHALHQSVARRLAAMELIERGAQQLLLPLDPHGEADAGDETPDWQPAIGLRDGAMERRLLAALAAAAKTATANETKLSALARLLNRIAEPVIIFTEYRDTLAHVARAIARPAAVLHGGLSRQERSAALDAFATGGRTILLATDAAGEGLNLHRSCRTVVNLELPWNPMRLEQRIGRVDRIGQRRTVHAFHLIAAGTGEHRLLAELQGKIERARTDIGAPNPLGKSRSAAEAEIDVDHRTARFVIGDADGGLPLTVTTATNDDPELQPLSSFQADGVAEARRLAAERALACHSRESTLVQPGTHGPLAAIARNARTRTRLGARVLLIWEVGVEDGCGRCVFCRPMAVALSLSRLSRARPDSRWINHVVGLAGADAMVAVNAASAPSRDSAIATVRSFVAARIRREHDIAAVVAPAAYQPGLFDRRIHHAQAAARAVQQEMANAAARRIDGLARQAELVIVPPVLRLVLVP